MDSMNVLVTHSSAAQEEEVRLRKGGEAATAVLARSGGEAAGISPVSVVPSYSIFLRSKAKDSTISSTRAFCL